MSEHESDYNREVRDIILKSSLTGVFATALAVTAFSPAGFGGMIGTSVASGFGIDTSAEDNAYARLPAFPAPLSAEEVSNIRMQLERTAASLELTRAATEEKIEHIRAIALSGHAVTFEAPRAPAVVHAPVVQAAAEPEALRVTFSVPDPLPMPAPEPVGAEAAPNASLSYRDSHLEFADLLLNY